MARVTKQPDERKQEIITASRKLFCEQGFDKTTIADISSYLNVAQGLVYHYFRSKTDILYAVVDEISVERVQSIEKEILEYKGTAIECLRLLLRNAYESIQEKEKLISSLKDNQGVLEYIRMRRIVLSSPILTKLIEKGNADKSWVCNYPKESADFILHGVSGYNVCFNSEQLEDIIIRILGVKT